MDRILEEIIAAIKQTGMEEEISAEDSLMDDLELESMQIFELLDQLETVFAIRIPEKILMRIDTVQDLAEEIEKIIN